MKKVEDFLEDRIDPRLKTIKENVIGDTAINGDFANYHKYAQTIHCQILG